MAMDEQGENIDPFGGRMRVGSLLDVVDEVRQYLTERGIISASIIGDQIHVMYKSGRSISLGDV